MVATVIVRLAESNEEVPAEVTAYLNRLSDLLWLFGRWMAFEVGVLKPEGPP